MIWSKAGLISKRIDEIKTCVICEWNLELAYFGEQKDLNFDDLAGPVKKMAIPQHGPQNNYGHKISKRFIQADYSNNKAHTLAKGGISYIP